MQLLHLLNYQGVGFDVNVTPPESDKVSSAVVNILRAQALAQPSYEPLFKLLDFLVTTGPFPESNLTLTVPWEQLEAWGLVVWLVGPEKFLGATQSGEVVRDLAKLMLDTGGLK